MTVAIDGSEQVPPPEGYLLLENVSWKLYEQIRRETDDGHLQITFDSGSMEITSPSPRHERLKKLLSLFIRIIALERDIPICDLDSTTFTREDLLKGVGHNGLELSSGNSNRGREFARRSKGGWHFPFSALNIWMVSCG
jgi:hypothetical protein